MNELDLVGLNLGHESAQEVIKSLGAYINKHFGAVGGFSSRQNRDQIVIVLPFSDLKEAECILEDFGRDFREKVLHHIRAGAEIPEEECFEFSGLAGWPKENLMTRLSPL